MREAIGLEQWQSTKQVLQWFQNIDKKKDRFFLQFDIVDFYPSITVELLNKAIKYAEEQGFPLTKQQKEIVMNARKSLLYARKKPEEKHVPLQKKKKTKTVSLTSQREHLTEPKYVNWWDYSLSAN